MADFSVHDLSFDCPLCGSKNHLVGSGPMAHSEVKCSHCGADLGDWDTLIQKSEGRSPDEPTEKR